MKKLICAALAVLLLALTAVPALADEALPFELKAPVNVALEYLDGRDSPTTHGFSYSYDGEMLKFFEAFNAAEDKDAFLAPYGLYDVSLTLQVDWAIDDPDDSVSGWHCNKYWDYSEYYGIFGCDGDGNCRVSDWDVVDSWPDFGSSVGEIWMLRSVPNDIRLNGDKSTGTPGVKDQLRPEQYTYDYENEELIIDFTEHTAYARARFVLTGLRIDEDGWKLLGVSPWSEAASAGKNGDKYVTVTADDLPAPVISGLRMTDKEFNDNPVAAFTLTVPDDLAALATKTAARGGGVVVETEARVKGDSEWTSMGNTDCEVRTGELECALLSLVNGERPTVPKDAEIELRCRYRCYQPDEDDVFSEYSKVITFGTEEIHDGGSPAPEAEHEPDTESGKPSGSACPICRFCPQPLGLCIFIWLAILVLLILVIVIVIAVSKKKRKN